MPRLSLPLRLFFNHSDPQSLLLLLAPFSVRGKKKVKNKTPKRKGFEKSYTPGRLELGIKRVELQISATSVGGAELTIRH